MVGAMGKALAARGHRVGIVTPLYAGVRERFAGMRPLNFPLDVPLGMDRARGDVWQLDAAEGLTVYFIEQPGFYERPGLYQHFGADYPDNAERFTFFSKVIVHMALHLPWKPEVVHLNDWQTGLAALLLYHQRLLPGWNTAPQTCLTIHNLAYQGVYPTAKYSLLNVPWSYYNVAGAEFYGQVNCLKSGIAFSREITTVSPTYAREITTPEYGCGLDGLLTLRRSALSGIINGVDYDEWNPASDPHIPHRFDLSDISGKAVCKAELQREFGLPVDPSIPLFGNIGRLADQKGVDILLAAMEQLLQERLQFVLLGSGSLAFQRAFRDMAKRFPDSASVHIGFDEGMSHRIEAGADFFLMPSRFEPCGLNQMYSLRYGTIPIVRRTGGLEDTVTDPRDDMHAANGIKFKDYSAEALAKAIRKGLVLFSDRDLMAAFRRQAMNRDFSWTRTAEAYEGAYGRLIG